MFWFWDELILKVFKYLIWERWYIKRYVDFCNLQRTMDSGERWESQLPINPSQWSNHNSSFIALIIHRILFIADDGKWGKLESWWWGWGSSISLKLFFILRGGRRDSTTMIEWLSLELVFLSVFFSRRAHYYIEKGLPTILSNKKIIE